MNAPASADSVPLVYPPGFRQRRGLNWAFLGLLYTSYYLCRYNFSIANESISKEFHFTREDMGVIITTALLAYACGQIINGFICDLIGGKRSMLIGAAGTIVMNVLFGVASFWGMLGLFVAIRGVDGYLQAYGSPGMVKINTAWFSHRERGRFAGIYGFMINLGRMGIFHIGPALLAGFTFMGLLQIPPLHWRWLFWVPSGICALAAIAMAVTVKETPEEAGYFNTPAAEPASENSEKIRFKELVFRMALHPTIWIVALAYGCTGAVRQSVDQWFPRYMDEMYKLDMHSNKFAWFLGTGIPVVSSAGSLISGYVSDTIFKGRRAPVAAALYFIEATVILCAAQFHSTNAVIFFLVLISFTANSTHSILGTAAAMDIGGREQSGFASGIIDSFQYFGGSLAGVVLGRLLDKSLGYYFYFMAPFGIVGGLLMLLVMGRISPAKKPGIG